MTTIKSKILPLSYGKFLEAAISKDESRGVLHDNIGIIAHSDGTTTIGATDGFRLHFIDTAKEDAESILPTGSYLLTFSKTTAIVTEDKSAGKYPDYMFLARPQRTATAPLFGWITLSSATVKALDKAGFIARFSLSTKENGDVDGFGFKGFFPKAEGSTAGTWSCNPVFVQDALAAMGDEVIVQYPLAPDNDDPAHLMNNRPIVLKAGDFGAAIMPMYRK